MFIRFCLFILSTGFNRFLSRIKRLVEYRPCIKFCGLIKTIISCWSSLLASWFASRECASLRHSCSPGISLCVWNVQANTRPLPKAWLVSEHRFWCWTSRRRLFSWFGPSSHCSGNFCGQFYCCFNCFLIFSAGMFLSFSPVVIGIYPLSLSFGVVYIVMFIDPKTWWALTLCQANC